VPRYHLLALAAVLATASGADAQLPPLPATGPFELGLGLTMQSPEDVNLSPKCVELSLPCDGRKGFPDAGISATVGAYLPVGLGMTAEFGMYGNRWKSSAGKETNRVVHGLGGLGFRTRLIEFGSRQPVFMRARVNALGGVQNSTVGGEEFVFQFGFAAEGRVRPGFWLRAGFDFRVGEDRYRELSGGRTWLGAAFTS